MIRYEQEQLDVEVATRLCGFGWVQWSRDAPGGGPLYRPGHFLASPDDPIWHLLEDAPAPGWASVRAEKVWR